MLFFTLCRPIINWRLMFCSSDNSIVFDAYASYTHKTRLNIHVQSLPLQAQRNRGTRWKYTYVQRQANRKGKRRQFGKQSIRRIVNWKWSESVTQSNCIQFAEVIGGVKANVMPVHRREHVSRLQSACVPSCVASICVYDLNRYLLLRCIFCLFYVIWC